MATNPLLPNPPRPQTPQNPMKQHAQIWQHVQQMPAQDLEQMATRTSESLPFIGQLAANPKVARKDVIKAAADAVGRGDAEPSQAVQMISQMPDDPNDLRKWLKGLYETNMTGLVHMKARMMQMAQAGQPAAAPLPQQQVPPQ